MEEQVQETGTQEAAAGLAVRATCAHSTGHSVACAQVGMCGCARLTDGLVGSDCMCKSSDGCGSRQARRYETMANDSRLVGDGDGVLA